MTIESVRPLGSVVPGVPAPGDVRAPGGSPRSFADALGQAVKEVDSLHHAADREVEKMVLSENANPHDAMVALEKADIAFQLMSQVRAKIVKAYEDILRTQV